MVIKVCCPTCWKWTELGTVMTCKRCHTPLILMDGRRVDEVNAEQAPGPATAGPPEPPPLEVVPEGWGLRVRAIESSSTDSSMPLPPPTF